jgi:hypothetical protein
VVVVVVVVVVGGRIYTTLGVGLLCWTLGEKRLECV